MEIIYATINKIRNKIGNLKITNSKQKQKLIGALLTLVLMIFSPLAFAKNEAPKELAKADAENNIPSPVASLAQAPSIAPTPEPKQDDTAPPVKKPVKTKVPAQPDNSTRPQTESTKASQPAAQSSNPGSTNNSESSAAKPAVFGILGYINQVRVENNLAELSYNSDLNSAARSKSQDMLDKDYFAHTNPDGKTDFDFIREAGYSFSFAGSNIAKGSFTEKSVFDAWMNSAGHRANILDPRAREFGYGVAGNYFTMMVGAR